MKLSWWMWPAWPIMRLQCLFGLHLCLKRPLPDICEGPRSEYLCPWCGARDVG